MALPRTPRPGTGDDTEMKPFVVNAHRRLVFPSNFFPEPDFSSIDTVEDLAAIVRRDFEVKAPTGSEIAAQAQSGGYGNRYELLRDLGLHLFWMNRYVITMYEKRPTRWRDVPRRRDDLFIPAVTPWEDGERKVAAVEACYRQLTAAWSPEVEHELFLMLFDVFRHKRHHATDLPALKPTVAEAVATGSQLVYRLGSYEPDYPRFSLGEILDCHENVPKLEDAALAARAFVADRADPGSAARREIDMRRGRHNRLGSSRSALTGVFPHGSGRYPDTGGTAPTAGRRGRCAAAPRRQRVPWAAGARLAGGAPRLSRRRPPASAGRARRPGRRRRPSAASTVQHFGSVDLDARRPQPYRRAPPPCPVRRGPAGAVRRVSASVPALSEGSSLGVRLRWPLSMAG